jgi:hypothetical protein
MTHPRRRGTLQLHLLLNGSQTGQQLRNRRLRQEQDDLILKVVKNVLVEPVSLNFFSE